MSGSHDDGAFVFGDPEGRLTDRKRLERLRNTGLLDLPHLPGLDSLTRLAAHVTSSPVAVVSLVESERQVFPSYHGPDSPLVENRVTSNSYSLDQYVVVNDAPLVVGDARDHPVLHEHPAVAQWGLVAYAGYPLHDPDGVVLGSLCVVDLVARRWSEDDLAALRDLASAVETMIALRLSQRQTHVDHERLLHVLNGAANTMILIADADGVVTTMNETAEQLLSSGPRPDEPWTLSGLASVAMPRAVVGNTDDATDWSVPHPDGRDRVISVRVSVLRDNAGQVEGYVVVGDDVSARREAEEVLRDTVRQQATVVRHLEALDVSRSDFIATASHELRTPVTTILGYTELLTDGEVGELTPAQLGVVGRVNRNSHRLLYLVEDLLSLSRIDSTEVALVRTSIDVDALVHRAWDGLLAVLAHRDLSAALDVAPGSSSLMGDPVQLERALLNLLTNAVKFTPDGGSVRLSVQQDDAEAVFTVTDSGIGIAPDEQAAVFDPFFRTQAAQVQAVPGSGVGLAVVRRIVEAHDGRVTLCSEPGRGTSVSIAVPLRADLGAGDGADVGATRGPADDRASSLQPLP